MLAIKVVVPLQKKKDDKNEPYLKLQNHRTVLVQSSQHTQLRALCRMLTKTYFISALQGAAATCSVPW